MNGRARSIDYWAVCRDCRAQFTFAVWMVPDPAHRGAWMGRVERQSDLLLERGYPYHKCGSTLNVYGPYRRVYLVE